MTKVLIVGATMGAIAAMVSKIVAEYPVCKSYNDHVWKPWATGFKECEKCHGLERVEEEGPSLMEVGI